MLRSFFGKYSDIPPPPKAPWKPRERREAEALHYAVERVAALPWHGGVSEDFYMPVRMFERLSADERADMMTLMEQTKKNYITHGYSQTEGRTVFIAQGMLAEILATKYAIGAPSTQTRVDVLTHSAGIGRESNGVGGMA